MKLENMVLMLVSFGLVNNLLLIKNLGALCFIIYVPLCLVRKIEKFAWTHLVADALIMITTVVILVYALLKLSRDGWGHGN